MNKVCILFAVTVFGWLGWWAGGLFNMGLMGSYLLGAVGSLFGVYVGWFVNKNYLS